MLLVSSNAATGRFLGETIRRRGKCRVLQASDSAEARYLAAVGGNIRLLLADSLSNENLGLARWFLATHPGAMVLAAEASLWKLTGGAGRYEQMLLAKSYTAQELASTVRALVLGEHRNGAAEAASRFKRAA
ncbi:MAG TPA: hypothetical protein VMU04_21955 [Candidatus Acidoferrum sp.]|nr:hypothetical protein [Candidatus Acidoferrum sp.]